MTQHQAPRAQMAEPLGRGRIFGQTMRPLLADCAPSGRIRLDALARWLQDIAYDDIEDAGIQGAAVWVIRRTRIRVERFPSFGEPVRVETFASGIGRMWAERRTTVRSIGEETVGGRPMSNGHRGAAPSNGANSTDAISREGASRSLVEAVTLWIHLDPQRRTPTPLTDAETSIYAEAAGDRRFSHRLVHPKPDHLEPVAESEWFFRRSDLDLADHVNNAAYWEPLEEELLADGDDPGVVDAEIEFRAPAQPGPIRILSSGCYRWLTEPGCGEVLASMLVTYAGAGLGSKATHYP